MAKAIDNLMVHPEEVERLSRGTIACAEKFMWSNRIALFNKVYTDIMKRYGK